MTSSRLFTRNSRFRAMRSESDVANHIRSDRQPRASFILARSKGRPSYSHSYTTMVTASHASSHTSAHTTVITRHAFQGQSSSLARSPVCLH